MSLRLPIGYDIFGQILKNNFDIVDKTLLIREILEDWAQVIVITRPRRFGKTLNLSMLQHFFAAQVSGMYQTQGLFDRFKIAALGDQYMRRQGKYPVIFLTLKDVKDHSFDIAYEKIQLLMAEIYQEHRVVLTSLDEEEKSFYHRILAKEGTTSELQAT